MMNFEASETPGIGSLDGIKEFLRPCYFKLAMKSFLFLHGPRDTVCGMQNVCRSRALHGYLFSFIATDPSPIFQTDRKKETHDPV